jgi:hypothetical protein
LSRLSRDTWGIWKYVIKFFYYSIYTDIAGGIDPGLSRESRVQGGEGCVILVSPAPPDQAIDHDEGGLLLPRLAGDCSVCRSRRVNPVQTFSRLCLPGGTASVTRYCAYSFTMMWMSQE